MPLLDADKRTWLVCVLGIVLLPLAWPIHVNGQKADDDKTKSDIEYFETEIQPILEKRCLECHGDSPNELGGNLALISRRTILSGGDSGPAAELDDPSASLLLDAINYGTYEMPPEGKLPQDEIDKLTRWIEMKLPWSEATAESTIELKHGQVPIVDESSKSFWSFQKVKMPEIPAVADESWPANKVDHFVLSRLESAGLFPARDATKQALVRRVYYDLTGLPPSTQQVTEFVNDDSDDAFANLVDSLLASPHYGEKWGRHWLDLVRYAESNSFERDGTKPFVWRYRDFVIRSFNEDKPYDQFLTEQLAGDQIDQPTSASIIATGYYRLGQWDDEPADRKQALYDDLDDIIATTSQAMMGLTVNCARCHDHKIDPIPTKDYYQMLSFFRNVKRYGVRGHDSVLRNSTSQLELEAPPDSKLVEAHQNKILEHEKAMDEIVDVVKDDLSPVELEDFQYVENHERLIRKRLESKTISRAQFDQFIRSRNEIRKLKANPPNLYRVLCVNEHDQPPPQTHVLIRGNPHVNGKPVEPGFVSVLSPPAPEISIDIESKLPKRRLSLAKWIASADHPLTARVMVNRIWQHHFGRGIVRSTNDFGFQGDKPTHPLLLDFLAKQFVDNAWSVKKLHRMILLSRTYRMSGEFNAAASEMDPLNDLFWRFNLRRLTAEEIRDSILAVSNRLNRNAMFGPSVYTRLSHEVLSGQSMPGSGWGNSSEPETRRRSLYIHVKRSLRVPLLEVFDSADTDFTCPVRFNTTQPTQALALVNGEFANQEALEFAKNVSAERAEVRDQVREVLFRVTQNEPSFDNINDGIRLIETLIEKDGLTAENALAMFCLTAFNLNEFVFVE